MKEKRMKKMTKRMKKITIETSKEKIAIIVILAVSILLLLNNSIQLRSLNSVESGYMKPASKDRIDIIPKGIPERYGVELGISFDGVTAQNPQLADNTIAVLAKLDRSVNLEGEDKQRYINILYKLNKGISCEYCCGAKSIIFESGEAACGCAHSFAMRGLAKYLITEHSDLTDEQMQEEVAKWKVLFFPSQQTQKAQVLKDKGIETTYANLGSNKYRGIEKGTTGTGMVGGC